MKVSILNFLFLYSVLENETLESFFAKSAKEEGGGWRGIGVQKTAAILDEMHMWMILYYIKFF